VTRASPGVTGRPLAGVVFWAIGARNVRRGLLAPAKVEQEAP
jgi:hypothetical protein